VPLEEEGHRELGFYVRDLKSELSQHGAPSVRSAAAQAFS